MTFNFNNDKFRILMIADTQEGSKVCSDTINLINAALDRSEPDLVVFSGDQIWGKSSFKGDKQKVTNALSQITEPVVSRNIPFAICFGNHDRQVGLSNEEQFEIYKTFKGFVGESAKNIDGVGNQVIEINDENETKYLLYLIDSHSNLSYGYDHVHENQIQWYKNVRDSYIEKTGKAIPSVVIQHIPIFEVFGLLNKVKRTTKGAVRGFRNHDKQYFVLNKDKVNSDGFMKESPAEPQENSGEFEAFKEKGDVKGVYFGHDHNNSFNGLIDGIDVGYTQGAGFNVYGPGYDRGVRVIDLFKDGKLETFDLRYKNLIGKKTDHPLKYSLLQLAPTNVFDAVTKIAKIFVGIAVICVICLIITMIFGAF